MTSCSFSVSATHSGIYRDFLESLSECSKVRCCTEINTHLLIDYKEYADVRFTDSLKPAGSSNMAHHHSFQSCVCGFVSQRLCLSLQTPFWLQLHPPVFLPVHFIAPSGSLHESNLAPLEILYSRQSEFSYLSLVPRNISLGIYSAAHTLTIDHSRLML